MHELMKNEPQVKRDLNDISNEISENLLNGFDAKEQREILNNVESRLHCYYSELINKHQALTIEFEEKLKTIASK